MSSLSSPRLELVKKLFGALDANGNGSIDWKEFQCFLAGSKSHWTSVTAEGLTESFLAENVETFKFFDKDSDDLISLEEFCDPRLGWDRGPVSRLELMVAAATAGIKRIPDKIKMAPPACKDASNTVTVKLNNGTSMPVLGLGTFLSAPGIVGEAVVTAIKAGYRHIDCAAMYGNEKEVGAALKGLFDDQTNDIKRTDVWITSKIAPWEMRPDNVRKALEKILSDLQLEYLDLYLIHQPVPLEHDPTYDGSHRIVGKFRPLRRQAFGVQDIWRAMEGCQAAGLTKAIGVSNFHCQLLNDMLCYAHICPAVNQVERHPYFSQPKLMSFCAKWGIVVTGYAPLSAPGLYGAGAKDKLLDNATVASIAKTYKKSAAQVLIRWAIDTGAVTIPKSSNAKRIVENGDVFDFKLTAADLLALGALEKGPSGRLFQQDWHGVPSFAI